MIFGHRVILSPTRSRLQLVFDNVDFGRVWNAYGEQLIIIQMVSLMLKGLNTTGHERWVGETLDALLVTTKPERHELLIVSIAGPLNTP